MKKLGLIVNPIAGVGGRVGLKGSDGDASKRAFELGAVPIAPQRATDALKEISRNRNDVEILSYLGDMGENEAKAAGFKPQVIGSIQPGKTTATDTRKAAKEMLDARVELLLFAGGDGTAKDICESVGEKLLVLGIPAGVKMHSGVFAINPRIAGQLTVSYLNGGASTRSMEVVDFVELDRESQSQERQLKLFGYLTTPFERTAIQGMKTASTPEDDGEEAIANSIIDDIVDCNDDYFYIVGPGKTAKAVLVAMGLENTILGIDVFYEKRVVLKDANEKQLLDLIDAKKAKIIMGVIGGQGFLFGRGNQQLSPEVIRRVGKDNTVVVSTKSKILALRGRPILVDTGDEALDQQLSGFWRIRTGYGTSIVYRIACERRNLSASQE
jgi:predicted polyphosphate/ATP-dependent NAD kinase